MLVKAVQPRNTLSPIEVTLSGNFILVKLSHFAKASGPIEVTLSGIVTLVKLIHSKKELIPVIQFGNITLIKPLDFVNQVISLITFFEKSADTFNLLKSSDTLIFSFFSKSRKVTNLSIVSSLSSSITINFIGSLGNVSNILTASCIDTFCVCFKEPLAFSFAVRTTRKPVLSLRGLCAKSHPMLNENIQLNSEESQPPIRRWRKPSKASSPHHSSTLPLMSYNP